MSRCIIRSSSKFDTSVFKCDVEHIFDCYNYYAFDMSSMRVSDSITDMNSLLDSVKNDILASDKLDLWREKEQMYNFKTIEETWYTREYHNLKNSLCDDILNGVFLTSDLDLFSIRVRINCNYHDFMSSKDRSYLVIVQLFEDIVCNTAYNEVDFSSISSYFATRDKVLCI